MSGNKLVVTVNGRQAVQMTSLAMGAVEAAEHIEANGVLAGNFGVIKAVAAGFTGSLDPKTGLLTCNGTEFTLKDAALKGALGSIDVGMKKADIEYTDGKVAEVSYNVPGPGIDTNGIKQACDAKGR